ncbi:MAG: hypothetical protein FWG21_03060 [Oscillospiraceae bacterium]|nr:hypothetical protein [Oscillospiraceae bacterium]
MLEIIAVYYLCKKNSQNAKARGRKGSGAVAYTIALWLGFEFVGAFVGAFVSLILGSDGEVAIIYVLALLFAALGGFIANTISKAGPIVQDANSIPQVNLQPLPNQPYNPYQCRICGHINPSDSLFCMKCGTPLNIVQTQ